MSVNSDDEELDYEDDVAFEESGSIDQDQDSDGDHGNQAAVKLSQNKAASVNEGDIPLGASSASLTDEQMILNNPHLRKLLDRMLDECIQEANHKGETSSSQLLTTLSPNNVQNGQGTKRKSTETNSGMIINRIKSPSDTTIYVLALKRSNKLTGNLDVVGGVLNTDKFLQE